MVRGRLDALLRKETQRVTVILKDASGSFETYCRQGGHKVERLGDRLHVEIEGGGQVQPFFSYS